MPFIINVPHYGEGEKKFTFINSTNNLILLKQVKKLARLKCEIVIKF